MQRPQVFGGSVAFYFVENECRGSVADNLDSTGRNEQLARIRIPTAWQFQRRENKRTRMTLVRPLS
jgi:hypothetical protein